MFHKFVLLQPKKIIKNKVHIYGNKNKYLFGIEAPL